MDMNEATAKAIAAERGASGLSIKALSEKSGIPERTLIRILKDERDIKINQVAQLCEVFGILPSTLMEEAQKFQLRESSASPTTERSQHGLSDDAPLTADEIMTLAANTDPNRDMEAETPRD